MPYVRDLLQVNCEAKQKSVNMSILDIIIEIIALKLLIPQRFVTLYDILALIIISNDSCNFLSNQVNQSDLYSYRHLAMIIVLLITPNIAK